MSNSRFYSAIVFTAVLSGGLVGAATLSRPAHADVPRTAECKAIALLAPPAIEAWMNTALAEGKSSFFSPNGSVTCAW